MGRIIRADREGPATLSQEVYDAKVEAQRIIERATSLGGELIEEASAQAQTLRSKARAEGLEEARAEAATLLLEARALYGQTLASAQAEIIPIAIAAAERIVGHALESEPDIIATIVSPILARARNAHQVTVKVHPLDLEGLQKAAARLAIEADLSDAFCIEPDDTMARGGCVVCTDAGTLEATIEVQLASLARALTT